MRRCLQLAANGWMNARPNPMVGAVIVAQGRIIGEGYHQRCGEAHAEVNAFRSVAAADEKLLPEATLYVSLEPCAHHGKTPPCADLVVSKGIKRCVIGCVDPFSEVQGRGIERLKKAGIDVVTGVLEEECRELNRRFFTYHQQKRPYIILKWAQTSNGYIDNEYHALAISTPFTQMLVHKLRAESDAILIGHTTDEREHPQLNVRYWHGKNPQRLVLTHDQPLPDLIARLYDDGVQSLLVEGGSRTLQTFFNAGLWDEARVEISPMTVLHGTEAPRLPRDARVIGREEYDGHVIVHYR